MEITGIEKLTELLLKEKEKYSVFLSFSKQKKSSVISGDIEKLNSIVKIEEIQLYELAQLEKERAKLIGALAEQFGFDIKDTDISTLADATEDPALKKKLKTVGNELSVMIKKQLKNNKMIKELINRKKRYTDAMLEALVHTEPLDTYNSEGNIGLRFAGPGFFDQRV